MKSPFSGLTCKAAGRRAQPVFPPSKLSSPVSKPLSQGHAEFSLPLMGVEEVSELTGLSERCLRKLYRRGQISAFRDGARLHFSVSVILQELDLLYRRADVSAPGAFRDAV